MLQDWVRSVSQPAGRASQNSRRAALFGAAAALDRKEPRGIFRAAQATGAFRTSRNPGWRILRADPDFHSRSGPDRTTETTFRVHRKAFREAADWGLAGRTRLGAAASRGARGGQYQL